MCLIFTVESTLAFDSVTDCHVGIAHTRWATHGVPNAQNAHPQRSDVDNTFCLVHNGIITNYKDIKLFLAKKGFTFESDTDTEVIAKLMLHVYQNHPDSTFQEIVELTIQQLVRFERVFSSHRF